MKILLLAASDGIRLILMVRTITLNKFIFKKGITKNAR